MGEIADDVISGACCSLCFQYFVREHGYPVACRECWEEGYGYEKATAETM